MEQTFQALAGILQKAIPTVIFLIFLHLYFKVMLFGPLQKVLRQRDELTAGAKKAAEASMAAAERKAAEYERKFQEARAEVYRVQEETRRRWLADQAAQIAQARANAEVTMKAARAAIEVEAGDARRNLEATSAVLADEIATAILSRRVA